MIYWLAKFMMTVTLRVYYRKRYFSGFENVPDQGPVVLACNHPNSFLDAIILGTYLKRPVHFLARSDVFNTPLKLWILSKLKMIPIYRLQEGAENLDKNRDTFEKCHRIFREGGMVIIFSEGICVQELRLRPLKKGTARIALEYSKDGSNLTVVPVGLNYLFATEFRKDLVVSMDKPFNAADFAKEYNENNAKGIQAFNKTLDTALRKIVINLKDKENDIALKRIVEVSFNNQPSGEKLVKLASSLHDLSLTDKSRYDRVIALGKNYHEKLTAVGVSDQDIKKSPGTSLLYLPSLLFVGLFRVLFFPPVQLTLNIVKKKIRRVEFFDSVKVGGFGILSLLYIVILLIVSLTVAGKWGLLFIPAVWILGELALAGYDTIEQHNAATRLRKASSGLSALQQLRSQITEETNSVVDLVQAHHTHHPVG